MSDNSYDVIVIGLGSFGGAAANALVERGFSVAGFEQFQPGHDQGSVHGGSRIIRQSYFESPAYVPLLRRAYEGWEKLKVESGRDVYDLCGGIYVGDPASTVYAGSLAAAVEHDLPHEVLDAEQIRARFPTMNPQPDALAVYEDNAGYARPEETMFANAEVAARKGAELHFSEPVTHWAATPGGGVEVVTTKGTYSADRLVMASGAWAPRLLADLGLPLTVERMVFYWFTPTPTAALPLSAYDQANHPIYIEETHGNGQIYGFPMTDGLDGGFKLGFFRGGTPTTPELIDRVVHEEETRLMRARATEFFPGLTGPIVQAKTCMYTTSPDEHFILGLHPEHDQVAMMTGCSGHGFKFVPVIGEILADLAMTGKTDHDIALFDPQRFG
ncbi:N-methyl-L-tryptophan oxidase [Naumannella halotolerans]|uniref:N-methyl-L-tryptophan oxidase n=1 Tax=Naumannella halotolerans TaxID=993414 RepID=UPI00370D70A2